MTNPDKELLVEMLLQWEELWERGQDTPASELAKDHPELIDELARRIKVLKTVAWLDKPLGDDPPGDDPPAGSSPSPRTLGGRYRLDELIAEGGFAQVFRAYDPELQRTVAIKIPKPGRLESTASFQAEARRVARLKHDNIVPVLDVGLEGDICFIVAEYVEGGSLADRLVKGKPSRAEAIRWVGEIADALEYAHLNGVIHRDIKPANILIGANGRAKLADFGIAQSATKTGQFAPSLGTLRYMSPEQLEGKPADHRSDIYSLGVVLYESLTGRIPYSSSEPNVLRKEIVQGTLPAGNLPRGIKGVVAKALARSPHQRHESATRFASELKRASTQVAGTIAWPWVLVLGLLMVGGATAVIRTRGDESSKATQPSLQELLAIAKTNMLHEQYAQAEAGYTQALSLAPGNLDALKNRGYCRMNMDRLETAVQDFDSVLASRPDDATTLRSRSKAYGLLRDFPRAIADLERAIALMPDATELPGELATIYAIRSHERFQEADYAGSKADMDEVIRLAPHPAVNYSRRSACWFQMGEYEKALEDISHAIQREPVNAEFYGKRSLILEKLNRPDEAQRDRNKAEELSK